MLFLRVGVELIMIFGYKSNTLSKICVSVEEVGYLGTYKCADMWDVITNCTVVIPTWDDPRRSGCRV